MPITTFYLARHGQTQWNTIRKLQGTLDSPLTDEGIEQARQLAQSVKAQQINQIICSPLPRAKTTATICQQILQRPMKVEQKVIERSFGLWQGELFDDLTEQPHFEDIFYRVTEHAPPQGESGIACAERFAQGLIAIAKGNQEQPNQNILLITHGDILRCFCARLSETAFCDAYSQYGNGKLFIVQFNHKTRVFSQQ